MPTLTQEPIVVSANAGVIDLMTAAGRYLLVIIGAIPVLLKLLGSHDVLAIVAYFRGAEGTALLAALAAVASLAWGLFKTHKRGAQIATVALDNRVSDKIATTK